MPTMPMASAIGMRRNASSIIAMRPVSASLTARSGARLRAAPRPGDEDAQHVDEARERDRRRHEINERTDGDAQHGGGVAVARDAPRLEPHQPREEEHHR